VTGKRNKPAKQYELTAIGGDRYPSLEAAQAAVKGPLVEILVAAIHRGQANGTLVVVDGKVVLARRSDIESTPRN
jgi:hypothetical protein